MKPSVVSLYSGAGGLDFGFEAAGFRTAVAVEIDADCCASLRANRRRWPVVEADIIATTSREILTAGSLRKGEADVLIGGPPCQPFSKSGYWASGDAARLDDNRADTLGAYLRVMRDVKPRAFLLENVAGLAFKGKAEGLEHLLAGIAEVNRQAGTRYKVSWRVLNAAAYGVPQMRERVFLVGSRDGREFRFPEPTHGPNVDGGLDHSLERYRTTWDALGDLEPEPKEPGLEVNGKWGELLPSIPEGENYLWHTSRGGGLPLFGWRRRYWSFLLKIAKNRPSWTIQAQPGTATGPFHWRSRRLSKKELCRLQTFPDGLKLDFSRNVVQRMLGNAVPSLLAEVLATEIRSQLLDGPRRKRDPKLLPPDRGAPPSPENVAPVPEGYQSMIGDHSDHPGEGRGNRARALWSSEAQARLF